MLEKGKTYAYFTTDGTRGLDVTIETINNSIATSTSGSVGGLGPFTMHFDVNTGLGLNDYIGTRLEKLS